MSARTTVHLVRHGEVYNPTKVLYGRLPGFRLSDTGLAQAEVTARFLDGRDIVKVISSPLERAQQTAAPLAKEYGLEVEIDPRIIESSNYFEGGVVEPGPGILRHPQHWHALRNPFKPSWGEPYKTVAARVMAAVHDAREAARGHEVVLVSHQLPVFVTRRAAEGRPMWHRPDRRQCALASVTSLVYDQTPDGDQLTYVRYCEPNGPGINKQGSVGA
jgi:broad specificity phosphatase PhoE